MKKKVLALVLVVALVAALTVGLVACGGDNNGGEEVYNLQPIAAKDLKIGVLHIGLHTDKEGYSAAHQAGINDVIAHFGLDEATQVKYVDAIDDTDNAAVTTAIEECIADNCNVIIGTSFGFQTAMEAASHEYRDVYFSHGTGYMQNTNMNNYFGRIYQARFLSGVVAGLKTLETGNNNIGYVAAFGTEVAETCSGINAFALGAQAVNPNAEVKVSVLGKWLDQQKEKESAEALLGLGCGIITQHSDTKEPTTAAKNAVKFGIGYNTDMRNAINSESVLTSVIWHWGAYYKALIQAIIDGEWAEFGNYYGEYSDGLFGLADLSTKATANAAEVLKLVEDQMKLGAEGRANWDVFSGKRLVIENALTNPTLKFVEKDLVGYEIVNGAETTPHTIVPSGGASVDDGVIKGSMNYYVSGVKQINIK